MKKIGLIFFLLFLIPSSVNAQENLTAKEILAKTSSLISSSKGVNAAFSISSADSKGSGILKAQNGKFMMELPGAIVWYNGKEMYSYNANTEETTLINPSPQELAETNPLLYIKNLGDEYNISFSKDKEYGKYVIDLIPKSKKSEMKNMTVYIKKGDFTPDKLIATPISGNMFTINIISFKTGINMPGDTFEYPKSKFKGIELIDLR